MQSFISQKESPETYAESGLLNVRAVYFGKLG